MKRFVPACLLFAAAAGAVCAAGPVPVDALAATVNGDPIAVSDVLSAIRPYLADARRAAPLEKDPEALWSAAWTNALRDLENKQLVLQQYWAGDARLPDYAVDRTATERIEKQYGGDVHALQLALARDGLTYSDWKEMIEEQLIVTTMRQTYVNANVRVSPADVARAWETRRSEFAPAPRVRVAMAVFPAGDTEKTSAFLARVAAGESFADLVAAPTDEERMLGAGDYGFVDPAAALAAPIASTVLALADGKVSPPVVLGDWQYLVCRVETEKTGTDTLESAWERIEDTLWAEAAERRFEAWIAHLREGAAIREFPPEGIR